MCGLVAIMSRGGTWSREALERATDTLRHRGPDGRGTWVGPGGKAGLGHTRLSVIGLDNGAQPIASEDGRLHLSANGEFYDFESLREDLEQRGHAFSTGTDSEIALHLYEETGRACVEHLRGEFAFVLWDERMQVLWAVRDRFGIKPLYYAESDGVLYVASEVKALFAAGVAAAWDEETAYQQMFACFDPTRTLFKNVRQVPPDTAWWRRKAPFASNGTGMSNILVERLKRTGTQFVAQTGSMPFSRRPSASACGPTFPWVACSAVEWIHRPCWVWPHGLRLRRRPSPSHSTTRTMTKSPWPAVRPANSVQTTRSYR